MAITTTNNSNNNKNNNKNNKKIEKTNNSNNNFPHFPCNIQKQQKQHQKLVHHKSTKSNKIFDSKKSYNSSSSFSSSSSPTSFSSPNYSSFPFYFSSSYFFPSLPSTTFSPPHFQHIFFFKPSFSIFSLISTILFLLLLFSSTINCVDAQRLPLQSVDDNNNEDDNQGNGNRNSFIGAVSASLQQFGNSLRHRRDKLKMEEELQQQQQEEERQFQQMKKRFYAWDEMSAKRSLLPSARNLREAAAAAGDVSAEELLSRLMAGVAANEQQQREREEGEGEEGEGEENEEKLLQQNEVWKRGGEGIGLKKKKKKSFGKPIVFLKRPTQTSGGEPPFALRRSAFLLVGPSFG